jgi:hypothetical protein
VIEQGGTGQDLGKENVDPAPKRTHPRKPKVTKVCTTVDVLSLW